MLAVVLGTALAHLVVRTDVPFRPLMFAASLVPLIIPGILHTIAWLFLDPAMPNASQIQVTVAGSTISVIDGEILDADADGAPGGLFKFNFSTVSVTAIPGTVLVGQLVDPGPDLKPMTADDFSGGRCVPPNGVP